MKRGIVKAAAVLCCSLVETFAGACAGTTTELGVAGSSVEPPAAAVLRAWLTSYNTATLEAHREFIHVHFSAGAVEQRSALARAKSDLWLRMNLGLMDIVRIDSATETTATATVHQRLIDGWGHVTVRLSPGSKRLIESRSVTFFERPPRLSDIEVPRHDRALVSDISAFAKRLTEAGVFSGVVLIAKGEIPLLRASFGIARRNESRPVTLDTRFQLASVSKMFTAIAIGQLVDAGRLSLSDIVANVLPEYPNKNTARKLTITHLLTHSSGLPEYFFSPRYSGLQRTLMRPRDYWPLFAGDSLRFSPGSQWEYSNSNFALLGAIVERVSGMPFRKYVENHIFRRAGMNRTTFYEGAEATSVDVAVGYTRFKPGREPDLDSAHTVIVPRDRIAGPAGGGLSSAEDLMRFSRALLDLRLLSEQTTRTMLERKIRAEDGDWAMGFESHTWNGVRFVGHNGFFDGAFNQVDFYPELGYTIIVLSNTDMSGAGAIAYRLRLFLTAQKNLGP